MARTGTRVLGSSGAGIVGALIAAFVVPVVAAAKDRTHTSKTEAHMSDPNPSDFHFAFRSLMDPTGDPDLFVYMGVLRIDGHSRHAVMLENRWGDDLPDRPVGLFATTLTSDQVASLGKTVEGTRWNELPRPSGGGISAAAMSLDYARGQHLIQRSFNALNGELINAIEPVMSQVTDLMNLVGTHPLAPSTSR